MPSCSLINLGSCLPQVFFEFLRDIINAPLQPFLQITLHLLSEPINIDMFVRLWAIIVYLLSMFYVLLLVGSGLSFYDCRVLRDCRDKLDKFIYLMGILI
ncbi:MAG: hypothetical protein AABX53_01445 [Nanoarchaeota archaeon]